MKTFPMFLQMAGREVVIAGGGEQAAQKARLVLKTDAKLRLLAPELDPELADLVASGRATQDSARVTPESFEAAGLVFVASGCPALDRCLHALAKSAGALVNVVDQPHLCDAVTPSIVDRDPVVIAIGTEGTAPVLGRQIKSKIEQILEPNLGGLSALAGRMRGAVAANVALKDRRSFWDWIFSGPVRRAHARGAEREAAKLLKEAVAKGGAPNNGSQGRLTQIILGSADVDLLPLRAMRHLQEADMIFVEVGSPAEALELARRDAGRRSFAQGAAPIDRILAAVSDGENVVCLSKDAIGGLTPPEGAESETLGPAI